MLLATSKPGNFLQKKSSCAGFTVTRLFLALRTSCLIIPVLWMAAQHIPLFYNEVGHNYDIPPLASGFDSKTFALLILWEALRFSHKADRTWNESTDNFDSTITPDTPIYPVLTESILHLRPRFHCLQSQHKSYGTRKSTRIFLFLVIRFVGPQCP